MLPESSLQRERNQTAELSFTWLVTESLFFPVLIYNNTAVHDE